MQKIESTPLYLYRHSQSGCIKLAFVSFKSPAETAASPLMLSFAFLQVSH